MLSIGDLAGTFNHFKTSERKHDDGKRRCRHRPLVVSNDETRTTAIRCKCSYWTGAGSMVLLVPMRSHATKNGGRSKISQSSLFLFCSLCTGTITSSLAFLIRHHRERPRWVLVFNTWHMLPVYRRRRPPLHLRTMLHSRGGLLYFLRLFVAVWLGVNRAR